MPTLPTIADAFETCKSRNSLSTQTENEGIAATVTNTISKKAVPRLTCGLSLANASYIVVSVPTDNSLDVTSITRIAHINYLNARPRAFQFEKRIDYTATINPPSHLQSQPNPASPGATLATRQPRPIKTGHRITTYPFPHRIAPDSKIPTASARYPDTRIRGTNPRTTAPRTS